MSRIIKKRALLTAAITSLALVAVAIAFYSTVGSGEGNATTADNYANDLVISNTEPAETLVPGSEVQITGEIANDNPGSAKVGTITGSVTDATEVLTGTCAIADFTIDNIVLSGSDVIPANDSVGFTADLNMADTAVSQDACKGAELDIDWSSN